MIIFDAVIKGIQEYSKGHAATLSSQRTVALRDLVSRLRRLGTQYEQLLEINAKLTADEVAGMNDLVSFTQDDLRKMYAATGGDPNVTFDLVGSTMKAAFAAGNESVHATTAEQAELRAELETRIESYYYSAHRVQDLVGAILDLPKQFRCPGITMVRNHFIEHPKDKTVELNFGFGTGGPFVRPIRNPEFGDDKGLVENTREFVEQLERHFPVSAAT